MIETIPLLDLLGEFVSTFREWHYFAVGLALGFASGYVSRDVLDDLTPIGGDPE